ncbi:MAG: hypothetical protein ABIZ04_22985 [Opitutus sp.]
MHRRNFIKTTSGLIGMAALAPRLFSATTERDPFLLTLIRDNDESVRKGLGRQEKVEGQQQNGAMPDEYVIANPSATGGFIASIVNAWHCPESRYYQSRELVAPAEAAIGFLLQAQHQDGTIDMISTNFHSTPDTAFLLELIGPAIELLRISKWTPADRLRADLEKFTLNAGKALVTGGVHTPNHRWVVCGALARVNALFPNERYVARIDEWLAESVDQDPDGQYTEKSTSIYSAVVNQALGTVARLLHRTALLDTIRRNLEMTLFYVHPDGEVVTEASKRQDKYQRGSLGRYYYSYRWLALLDQDGRFAAMARQIEQTAAGQLGYMLAAFLTEPELLRALPPSSPLPTDYAKVFPYSKLARIRRGPVSATILADNSTLFSMRKGRAALEAVRLASAFFGKGQFIGEELVVEGGKYVLRQKLQGVYFQPLTKEQIAANGGKVLMAPNGTLATNQNEKRAHSDVQSLETVVTVTESQGQFDLTIDIAGTDHVPVSLELAFRHGGELRGVEPLPNVKDAFLLRKGEGEYVFDNQVIKFGPGKVEHVYTQVRGAIPKWDGLSVYLTGATPFRTTLHLA